MSEGWDFGFGIGGFLEGGFDWGTFGGLFPPIIDILRPPIPVPVVITELPQTWVPPTPVYVPPEVPPVLPGPSGGTVDPSPIIGSPTGADTPQQTDDVEEPPMAHDWGHLGRQLLGEGLTQAFGAPTALAQPTMIDFTDPTVTAQVSAPAAAAAACDGMAWGGGTPPKGYKVVNYCGQGVLRKVRRRRRRRLLTASDSRDIATIVGLVGKGQMASALINRR